MSFLKTIAPALAFIPGVGPELAAGAEVVGGLAGGNQGTASSAGAPQQAANTGSYYQNALGQLVSNTGTGSPLAQTFGAEQSAALQPQFQQQQQQLLAKLAAEGITGSGAAKNDLSGLAGQQASTLAGAIAPLYSQAASQAGSILGAQPGAQASSYQNALDQYYQSNQGIGNLLGLLPRTNTANTATQSDPYSTGGVQSQPNPYVTPVPYGVVPQAPSVNPLANVTPTFGGDTSNPGYSFDSSVPSFNYGGS